MISVIPAAIRWGAPVTRMFVILGSVALFTLLSAYSTPSNVQS